MTHEEIEIARLSPALQHTMAVAVLAGYRFELIWISREDTSFWRVYNPAGLPFAGNWFSQPLGDMIKRAAVDMHHSEEELPSR